MDYCISLSPLYEFCKKDTDFETGIQGNSRLGRSFGKEISRIVEEIPERSGFYIWGRFLPNKRWETIYLGKSEAGKIASLKARIREELSDERVFFWLKQMDEIELQKKYLSIYKGGQASLNHFLRSSKKYPAEYIIWCETDMFGEDITDIEAFLIEMLNPTANMIKKPFNAACLDEAFEIFKHFTTTVINLRHEKFNFQVDVDLQTA